MSTSNSDSTLSDEKNNKEQNKIEINDIYKESSFYPWIKPDSQFHCQTGMAKLHCEILDFYHFIQLNNEEKELRNKTYNDIKNIIEENFPDCTCELYGSFKTGLSLPNSDIDILILPKEVTMDDNNLDIRNDTILLKYLKKIYNIFEEKNIFSYLEIIIAKVPIIKCIYRKTNINVDISLFKENGATAVKLVDKIININPDMKPLILLIKYALRQRDLNEIYKGGVSSFIIFTLLYYYIVHYKKTNEYIMKNGKKEEIKTLGFLLLGFFTFYGFDFNYKRLGISIRNGCFLYKRTDESKHILSVENFQDITDMGKNCFQFKKVIDFFKFGKESLICHDYNVESFLKGFIFPDSILRERALKYK